VPRRSDGTLTIGITDHAQEALGDIVFLELPEAGRQRGQGEACAVIESVKAASDIYAPVAGEVLAANQDAVDAPESVNADAYANWLFKLKPADVRRACCRREARRPARRRSLRNAISPRPRHERRRPFSLPARQLEQRDDFIHRHLGPNAGEIAACCAAIGVADVDGLIAQTVPAGIRLSSPLPLAARCPSTRRSPA
jgi:glycine cleavage system H protein